MSDARPILATVAEIAVHYRVAPGTVRWWAHKDGWTAYGTRRHRRWDLRQAQESWSKRNVPHAGH